MRIINDQYEKRTTSIVGRLIDAIRAEIGHLDWVQEDPDGTTAGQWNMAMSRRGVLIEALGVLDSPLMNKKGRGGNV